MSLGDRANSAGESPPRRDLRHRAREAALQMLYQWEVGREGVDEVVRTYWSIDRPDEAPLSGSLQSFANTLLAGTVAHRDEIDPLIAAHSEHWRFSRLAVIDRLILRLAAFELLHSPDIPSKVVINEALELARTFSSDEAVGFVNGILDGIKREIEKGLRP